MSQLLFRRFSRLPLVLGRSRPLVGVDTKSSEVVHEILHQLFFLPPHAVRAPHQFSVHCALRQLTASSPPCAPQIPRIGFTSCALLPRCPHLSSSRACSDRNATSGRCDGFGATCRSGTPPGSTRRKRTSLSRVPRLLASEL